MVNSFYCGQKLKQQLQFKILEAQESLGLSLCRSPFILL
jgi:hypothetical protein